MGLLDIPNTITVEVSSVTKGSLTYEPEEGTFSSPAEDYTQLTLKGTRYEPLEFYLPNNQMTLNNKPISLTRTGLMTIGSYINVSDAPSITVNLKYRNTTYTGSVSIGDVVVDGNALVTFEKVQ